MTRRREEADFQQQIVELAESLGWAVWHDNDARRNRAGFPDLELLRGATMLRLEVKTAKGIVSDAQQAYIDRLNLVKFVTAAVVRPCNFEALTDTLRRAAR